ncbi:MAG: TerC/Alx family metal homeostasis membrane protein [Nitrospirae bacterium]|nr:TerC/Alx family metal homeostasis membrane protein [Nitrospirota bacterium]MBF0535944.1 TerC/Alx family metal homeostasis membrane protein [Nitrospirota bacterium]MBF0618080.1 TerC/Alx family metal homeostasis membrane protein [Nitrospirota bacterium]
MTQVSLLSISVFVVFTGISLYVDMHFNKKDTQVSVKSAAVWSVIWVLLALLFAGFIAVTESTVHASLFTAGYFLEKSLSVDNLFVFMAIFGSFTIEDRYQQRVLNFGIIGAIILRVIFIFAGTSLLLLGAWVNVIFALFVLWSAWQMYKQIGKDDEKIHDYTNHWSVRAAKRLMPVYPYLKDNKFIIKHNGKRHITPLMLCLTALVVADVVFAFDSVPAVITITQVPFLIVTSNIFAILGMRSMYFLLATAKRYVCYLEISVVLILVFVGLKMLLDFFDIYHISPAMSLGVLFLVFGGSVVLSLIYPQKIN